MNCPDVRRDEYFDGELDPSAREEVRSHVESCANCREQIGRLGRLERLLLEAGEAPSRSFRWAAGVAAAALFAAALSFAGRSSGPVDARAELEAYARSPEARIEERFRSGGAAVLDAALEDPDPRIQFAAAVLLFKVGDPAARERVVARFQPESGGDGGWVLSEPGAEEGDAEMVPVAVSMALEGRERRAMDLLRKLNRLDGEAQGRIVEAVVTLLKSPNPEVQRLALAIVDELSVEFPLSALVDLLDSPDLGGPARRALRQATGEDFGADKEAWKKVVESRKEES